ncbi:MAG: hypothetical protein JWO08_2745, partial [Verrucomicrobiaceae bacterium]|nr:hypothetical protein [Verrucomicrobiaceae bacterium]
MIFTLKDACKRVHWSPFLIAIVAAAVMLISGTGRATAIETPVAALATFNSATDVPITGDGYTVTGPPISITLNFTPAAGTILTVVNNTGLDFIQGTFSNLPHGSIVNLSFGGTMYPFVVNYYGGTGNDLVLQWAGSVAVAWGYNDHGQLGNNSTVSSAVPVIVDRSGVLLGKTILSVVAGSGHNLALCSDGTVASWGYNVYGELGNNTLTDSAVPVRVDQSGVLRGKTVVALAAGQYFSVALCSDGTLAAWGTGAYLGAGLKSAATAPVLVDRSGVLASKKVVALAAGLDHTLALCSDGTVVGWGANSNAQLGTGSIVYSAMGPVAVDRSGVFSNRKVIKISAGQYHSLALCSDGTLVAWGFNFYGSLGTAGGSNASPAVVNTGAMAGKTVVDMAANGAHSLAQCSDGTLLSWGYNEYGQIGIGSRGFTSVPVAVIASGALSGKTVTGLSGGAAHSLALCSDGTVASWGFNRYGGLGNNNMVDTYAPVAVVKSSLGAGARFMTATGGSIALHSVGLVGQPLGVLAPVPVEVA